MTCNVGKTDKIIRVIIGLAIVALGFYFKSWWGLLAVIPLLTAVLGYCPLYVPLKITTVKKKKKANKIQENIRRQANDL